MDQTTKNNSFEDSLKQRVKELSENKVGLELASVGNTAEEAICLSDEEESESDPNAAFWKAESEKIRGEKKNCHPGGC